MMCLAQVSWELDNAAAPSRTLTPSGTVSVHAYPTSPPRQHELIFFYHFLFSFVTFFYFAIFFTKIHFFFKNGFGPAVQMTFKGPKVSILASP